MRWTAKVEKDDFSEDYYIVFPDDLIDKMDWKEGDAITMDIIKVGIDVSLRITKKGEK